MVEDTLQESTPVDRFRNHCGLILKPNDPPISTPASLVSSRSSNASEVWLTSSIRGEPSENISSSDEDPNNASSSTWAATGARTRTIAKATAPKRRNLIDLM
jgi:hypothetical protein